MTLLGEITKRFNEGQAKVLMKEFQDAQVMMNVLELNAAAGRDRILSGEGLGFGVIVTPAAGEEMTDLVTVPDSQSIEPTSNKDKQLQYWRGQYEVAQRRIAVLEAERSPVPIMESVVGLKAANAHLTRQLAAQALAHAEQIRILQTRTYIAEGRVAELEMRVTPATAPTDAQQTASDMAAPAPPELRPDGTRKPVAREWAAPKSGGDTRRIGGF